MHFIFYYHLLGICNMSFYFAHFFFIWPMGKIIWIAHLFFFFLIVKFNICFTWSLFERKILNALGSMSYYWFYNTIRKCFDLWKVVTSNTLLKKKKKIACWGWHSPSFSSAPRRLLLDAPWVLEFQWYWLRGHEFISYSKSTT